MFKTLEVDIKSEHYKEIDTKHLVVIGEFKTVSFSMLSTLDMLF